MIVSLLVQNTWETFILTYINIRINISIIALLTKSCSKAGSDVFSHQFGMASNAYHAQASVPPSLTIKLKTSGQLNRDVCPQKQD